MPRSLMLIFLAVLTACIPSAPPIPTPFTFPSPAPASPDAPIPSVGATAIPPSPAVPATPAKPAFQVAVIADTTTEQVQSAQAQAVIDEASKYLTEFSPLGLQIVDFVEDGSGGRTAEMANRYVTTHAASLPNGLVIFSYGDERKARSSGGYGFSLPAAGFKNVFISPAGAEQIYVSVVDYTHKYMACGYGGSDSVQGSVSLAGECRGQTGIACVSHNGYSMCSNAVGNLYTSTPTHAVAGLIVHGLLHNFASGGDKDDYATPECNAHMGYPASFFDLQESEYYNGLCPFVYDEFTKSYRP